jgi:hypothetical protein
MKFPDCPDHGRRVLDLAQGRLDDASAAEAERILESCPRCGEWWSETLEGDAALTVDAAVDHAFASFQPPRRRIPIWMPAAAALLLMVGAGLIWSPGDRDPASIGDGAGTADLVRESFDGDVDGDGVVSVSDLGFELVSDEAIQQGPIFSDDVDSGDLSAWSSNT